MELRIQREDFNSSRTIGRLFVDDVFFCWTLEDAVRDGIKVPGKTAIPAGRYRVIINESNRFKRLMPLLLDVPGFSGVRIHSGNTASDTEGCILVGLSRTTDAVLGSRIAFNELFDRMQTPLAMGEEIWITVF